MEETCGCWFCLSRRGAGAASQQWSLVLGFGSPFCLSWESTWFLAKIELLNTQSGPGLRVKAALSGERGDVEADGGGPRRVSRLLCCVSPCDTSGEVGEHQYRSPEVPKTFRSRTLKIIRGPFHRYFKRKLICNQNSKSVQLTHLMCPLNITFF